MSWDSIKENDSDFTKFEAGKDVRVHILGGEPEKHVNHFIKGKPQPCGGDKCELCAAGDKKRLSFSLSVYNFTAKKDQKMEQGIMVFKQIKKIREVYSGDLSKVDLVISREGSGPTDTKYTVIAVPTQFKPEMITAPKEEVPF